MIKQGYPQMQWIILALAMLFSLILLTLATWLFQPDAAASKQAGTRIMPLGDSITYGQGSSKGGGYRWPLWQALQAQGESVTFVGSMRHGPAGFPAENQGVPGWKIDQIAARVSGWLKTYQPQIILLHIGTNDFVKNDDPARASLRLQRLIEQISAISPQATLIVAQIIPIGRNSQLNAEVMAYNAALPALVQNEVVRGRHVQLVDMYHAVSPSLLPDGVHPNDQAYDLMARVWEKALLPLLKH